MLTISYAIKGANRAKYYTNRAKDDYYANRNEKAGHWWGDGALALGLAGPVVTEVFQNLMYGLSPDGSEKLVQNALKADRQCGWDLTFSAPKSVSVFWAMSSPEVRAKIEAAHDDAVREALDYLEENAAITRRGKSGTKRDLLRPWNSIINPSPLS